MANDLVLWSKPNETSVLKFGKGIAVDSVAGLAGSIVNTVGDVAKVGVNLCQGDMVSVGEISKNRTYEFVNGLFGVLESIFAISKAGYDSVVHDEDFMIEENKAHLARIAQVGMACAIASAMLDGATSED